MADMSRVPVLDGRLLEGGGDQARDFARQFLAACRTAGCCYLAYPPMPAGSCGRILGAAAAFFGLPSREKGAVHIGKSPHFRGYSEMRNERDWREQVHFGPELPAASDGPEHLRLQGPNLWPAALGEEWRGAVLGFLHGVGELGRRLLRALALALGLPEGCLLGSTPEPPYLLLKLIHYHPQPAGHPARPGVAPHCDWSLITILLQSEVGGLQVRVPDGGWVDVPPLAGTLVVTLGELIQVATDGRLEAIPHRVCNHSSRRPRVSVPVFINPALSSVVSPAASWREAGAPTSPAPPVGGGTEHIHRVLAPGAAPRPFVFGESEWARKGLGRWCHDPACL
jgi:isopenicillin N synthase-like dioxygenase